MNAVKEHLPTALATARLALATPALAHVPAMAALANNKRVYAVLSRLPHPYGESDGRFFVETIARGEEEHAWAILHEDQFIGTIGLHFLPGQVPQLGYWLGEPFWGQGFATEAGRAVLAAARAAGAKAVHARALLDNAGSRHVLEKLGFRETGTVIDQSGTTAGRTLAAFELEFEP